MVMTTSKTYQSSQLFLTYLFLIIFQMARLIFLISMVALVAKISLVVYLMFLKSPPPIPDLDQNEWWGPGSRSEKLDTSIRPFKITFDNEVRCKSSYVSINLKS